MVMGAGLDPGPKRRKIIGRTAMKTVREELEGLRRARRGRVTSDVV